MGTRDFLVWVLVYVGAIIILIYIYKQYVNKKLIIAEADQIFLHKYIEEHRPNLTIRVYDSNGEIQEEGLDIEYDKPAEQESEADETQETEEEEQESLEEEQPEEPESTEQNVQQEGKPDTSTSSVTDQEPEPEPVVPIKEIKALAKEIAGGKRIRAKRGLQLQQNYPKELEVELAKLKSKKRVVKPQKSNTSTSSATNTSK